MAKVYVVQNQHRLNHETGELVPKFDLAPAREFGEIVFLLSPSAAPFRPDSVVSELRKKLFDFSDDSYLLLIGNPALIGMAVALAAESNGGRVRVLQWSGRAREYTPIDIDLGVAYRE